MSKKTAFLHDELCFWHTTSGNVGGGWSQPPTGASNSESPESKRRIKRLRGEQPADYRLVAGGFRVFYTVEGATVYILRILSKEGTSEFYVEESE